MIEFNGKISGLAEKHMWKRGKRITLAILILGLTVLFPFVILLWRKLESFYGFNIWVLPVMYVSLFIILPLIAWVLPKSKKEKNDLVTNKVFTDEEYIVVVLSNGHEEYKLISKAKRVNDYGDFYEIVFPLSAGISENFICQKSLLTKGTLEEFEALFEGKIVRKST
ncbi:MAG: hypothetical protein IKC61_02480 [Clostridia bacterium]|nr:hypothetical protein [Clostridia bacterium]